MARETIVDVLERITRDGGIETIDPQLAEQLMRDMATAATDQGDSLIAVMRRDDHGWPFVLFTIERCDAVEVDPYWEVGEGD